MEKEVLKMFSRILPRKIWKVKYILLGHSYSVRAHLQNSKLLSSFRVKARDQQLKVCDNATAAYHVASLLTSVHFDCLHPNNTLSQLGCVTCFKDFRPGTDWPSQGHV